MFEKTHTQKNNGVLDNASVRETTTMMESLHSVPLIKRSIEKSSASHVRRRASHESLKNFISRSEQSADVLTKAVQSAPLKLSENGRRDNSPERATRHAGTRLRRKQITLDQRTLD